MNSSSSEFRRSLVVMAHIDAGKTTLTERLLYLAGNIRAMGEVEDGLSTMDYLPEEQQRGISIEAGVAHLDWKNHSICLVDTPGHIDFSCEVDPFLRGVEGALIIISATSSLEPQTLECWRKVTEGKLTPMVFLNKLDLAHQPLEDILVDIEKQWNIEPLLMTLPHIEDGKLVGVIDVMHGKMVLCTNDVRDFQLVDIPESSIYTYKQMRQSMLDAASRHSETLTEKWLSGEEISVASIYQGLRLAIQAGEVLPMYCGSAKKGAGVRLLLNGLSFLMPSPKSHPDPSVLLEVLQLRHIHDEGVFSLARFYTSCTVGQFSFITDLYRPLGAHLTPVNYAEAGEILLWKPPASISPTWGTVLKNNGACEGRYTFPPPLLWVSVEAKTADGERNLADALENLARATPGIATARNVHNGTFLVGGLGEVQLEVFFERLNKCSNVDFARGEPHVDYIEKPAHTIGPFPVIGYWGEFTFESTVFLEPIETKEIEIELHADAPKEAKHIIQSAIHTWASSGLLGKGSLGYARFKISSIEWKQKLPPWPLVAKAVADTLRLSVKIQDFVCLEPIMELQCSFPIEFSGKVMGELESRGAKIEGLSTFGRIQKIDSKISLKNCFGYTTLLRSLTKGQGNLVLKYHQHESW